MQVTEIALKEVNRFYNKNYNFDDLKIPAENVEIGTLYFKRWLETFKKQGYDDSMALFYTLLTYSWGYGNLQNWFNQDNCNKVIGENIPHEKQEYNEKFVWWFEYAKRKFTLESQKNNDSSKPAPKAISNELNSGA